MRNITCLLMLIILCSCGASNDARRADVINYYGTIQAGMIFYYEQQQLFIDESTIAIHAVQAGGKPSTERLRILLDSAKDGNRSRYEMIVNVPEIDEEIRYKQKVLDYIEVFNAAYQKEFRDFISMLESEMSLEEKTTYMQQHLKPKLLSIKEKETVMINAREEIKEKYGLHEIDGVMKKVHEKLKNEK